MHKTIENCPICSHELTITKVFCEQCGTTLPGQIGTTASRFRNLTEEQMAFLMVFIRCEGKFNHMEEKLNLSYPTLKNPFNDILAAMGFENHQSEDEHLLTKDERMEILKNLDKGALNPEQAELLLRAKGAKSTEG